MFSILHFKYEYAKNGLFVRSILITYVLEVVLAVFDVFVIRWLLFANVKKVRLPSTEDMEKEYHQKWFHIKVLFSKLPFLIVNGIVVAFIAVFINTFA